MRTLTAVMSTVALALLAASGAFAQQRPDFSGTWTLVPQPASAAPAGGGPSGRGGGVNAPQQLTLTQDAKTLTISWTQGGKTTETLNLDGSWAALSA